MSRLLFGLLEYSITAFSASVSVAMVSHEVAASTPVAEWAFSFNLSIFDLVVLAYSIRHYSFSSVFSASTSGSASSSGSGSGSGCVSGFAFWFLSTIYLGSIFNAWVGSSYT